MCTILLLIAVASYLWTILWYGGIMGRPLILHLHVRLLWHQKLIVTSFIVNLAYFVRFSLRILSHILVDDCGRFHRDVINRMNFEWSRRPYTAPFVRDLIYKQGQSNHTTEKAEDMHRGEAIGQYKFVKHIPFSRRVSELPIQESQSGHMGGIGGCSSTLSVQSMVPSTAFGNQCSTQIRGSDIFFLPKPTQLLCFALPVFVLLPNLTVFARQWFFYAPK